MSSCTAANGIAGSSAQPSATRLPSGTCAAIASARETTLLMFPCSFPLLKLGPPARACSCLAVFAPHGKAARRSLPLVARLALLAERGDAFLEVLRREQAADGLVLEEHRVLERHA